MSPANGAQRQTLRQAFGMGTIRHWLTEPLVHFLLLGGLLFAAYSYYEPAYDVETAPTEINLTPEEVVAMWAFFQSQWQRTPTPEEMGRLVENKVREEVLYREAVAMGLDKDDTIVKRRMAQKLQFLAEDVAAAYEPDSAELKAWYAANVDKFTQPGRISFRQIYFSPDTRGDRAHVDAGDALVALADHDVDSGLAATLADPFMLQNYYSDRSPQQIAKEFGPVFAQSLFRTETETWQGPIESGFGWHLVFVDSFIPGRLPDFSEVEQEVKTAWLGEQKEKAWQKAYNEMRAKYVVNLPILDADTVSALSDGAPPADAAVGDSEVSR